MPTRVDANCSACRIGSVTVVRAKHEPVAFAEPWITGAEYTVAILLGQALPAIRIETPRSFYDYEAKYLRNDTRYFCPAGLAAAAEENLATLALAIRPASSTSPRRRTVRG